MIETKELDSFLSVLEDCDFLDKGFSGLCLIQQVVKYSDRLKLEIKKNWLMLSDDKILLYNEYVHDCIGKFDFQWVDEASAQLVLDDYSTSLYDVERSFITNNILEDLLLSFYKERRGVTRSVAYRLQRTLLDYFLGKHIQEISNIVSPEKLQRKIQFDSRIFKSVESFTWFDRTLKESGYIDESNNIKRGFQAFVSAIFDNEDCKQYIFTPSVLLYEYIHFLRNFYGVKIASDKELSSGQKHEIIVGEIVKVYKKSQPQ